MVIDAGKMFFVRFFRMKTSEEQILSLFPDPDFTTCPLLSVALALLTQKAPLAGVIANLSEQPNQTSLQLSPDVLFLEMLDHPTTVLGHGAPATGNLDMTSIIYAHVNRVLQRVANPQVWSLL